MLALNRKLLRDMWQMRGQVMAIGGVIASGVAVLVMSLSTLEALRETTTAYYERYQFAGIFANVKRAPESIVRQAGEIIGVDAVQTRIVNFATLDITGFSEPVMGQLVSLPDDSEPVLNKLALRAGRWPQADRHDEIILHEGFAEAHELRPGDHLRAVLNGRQRSLQVVGTALSPEFIYTLGPGALMPDDQRFGVIWMARSALAAAFDMENAFNDISIGLSHGARPEQVIQQLDQLLNRYGGTGAIARADQISNWFVMNEIEQMVTMSVILPSIFLLVAAFLTNMVLTRLVAREREQIGLLKAFGYRNIEIGMHYAWLVLGIALLGIAVGFFLGLWLGHVNTQMYANIYRFPLLLYRPSPAAFAIAASVSIVTALAGSAFAVRRAVTLPPAQAMQPPAPPVFRRSRLSDTRVGRWIDQPTRIMLRDIARWPVRSASTCTGIASAVALLVLIFHWQDSLEYLVQNYFFTAQRQDITIGLSEPQARTVVHDFEHMQGVLAVEPWRVVSADISFGAVRHRGSIIGLSSNAWLQPAYDDDRRMDVPMPDNGLVLSTSLADKLGVGIGDEIKVAVREGRRPVSRLPVADLIETHIGMPLYMHINALDRLLRERASAQFISLLIDKQFEQSFYREVKLLPAISAVMLRQAAVDAFYDTIITNLMVFISMFSMLACALGFGVAYNSTRIALSERGRELATLRVLGFRTSEIAYILLGEVALLIILALPVGCVLGYGLVNLMTKAFTTELYRVPPIIEPSTFGLAMVITLVATGLSAVIVGRRIKRLNLIKVLKTRE